MVLALARCCVQIEERQGAQCREDGCDLSDDAASYIIRSDQILRSWENST